MKRKLPAGWRLKPLGEVCLINPVKRKNLLNEANDLTSFVPMEAVDELTGRISKRIVRPFSEISGGYTFFEEGDILFAKITPCMENGKSAIVENLINDFGFGSTEFHVLRVGPEVIKEWVYYFVRTKEFRKEAEKSFRASAGQKRVPTHFIEKELIPLPPTVNDQIIITNELESKMAEIDKIRQSALRQREAITAMQGAILRQEFPWKEGDKLPTGWKWEEIGNHIFDYQSGIACGDKSKKIEGYPHLRMNKVYGNDSCENVIRILLKDFYASEPYN